MATIEEQTKLMLIKALQEVRPDIDVSQGTAIADTTIKAFMRLISPNVRAIESMHFRNSIRNAAFLSRVDMDDLQANWYLNRHQGSRATGTVRLFFDVAQDINLSVGSLVVSNEDNIAFLNPNAVFFDALTVQTNVEDGRFFVDVDVESVDIGNFPTPAGTVSKLEAGPSGISGITNIDDFYAGEEIESNIDFGLRGERAITVRNLVNNRSILTTLLEEFQFLNNVQVVGYGDAEMQRDTINLREIINLINNSPDTNIPVEVPNLSETSIENFHVGNKTDIYINRRNLITHSVNLTEDETDFVALFGSHNAVLNLRTLLDDDGNQRFNYPIFDIVSVQQLNSVLEPITLVDEIQEETENATNPNGFLNGFYNLEVLRTDLRFSVYEQLGLRLKSDLDELGAQIPGKTTLQGVPLRITYRYVDGVQEVQDYVEDPDNKLTLAEPLVKSKLPGFVDVYDTVAEEVVPMRVSLESGATVEDVVDLIDFFIDNVREALEVSDLIAFLYEQRVVTYVEQPLVLRVRIENENREIEEPIAPNPTRFDLRELEKRHVGFISEIEVEEILEF